MSVLNDTKFLAGAWRLSGNAADGTGRYPGTLVNTPTWATFMKNGLQCIELDGDDAHVNVGDVVELNSVSAFTICFWMSQDVLDVVDRAFYKILDGTNALTILSHGSGELRFYVANGTTPYGAFDYSTLISAGHWHHVAMVFDGSQTGNANRLLVFVDGAPVTLAFVGNIPATTADLSSIDFFIGYTNNSFDGKFFDFRIYSIPLSRDQVNQVIHGPLPVL